MELLSRLFESSNNEFKIGDRVRGKYRGKAEYECIISTELFCFFFDKKRQVSKKYSRVFITICKRIHILYF